MNDILLKDIENSLNIIFKKILNIEIVNHQDLLLGSNIGIHPRDLVYICLEIERTFKINIDNESISKYQFTTYDGIKEFIFAKLQAQK